MKLFPIILTVGLASELACSSTPAPTTPTLTVPQKDALTAAFHAADLAWNAVEASCYATATAAHDDTIRQKCVVVLEPARVDLIHAAALVDVWTASSPSGVACAVEDSLRIIATYAGSPTPPNVAAALALGQDIAGVCPDGGAP